MTDSPALPTTAAVVDLEAACQLYGRDVLPIPLGRSRPVGSVWLATREVASIEDRLNDGDLRGVRAWVEAVAWADVHVECRVYSFDEGMPDLRVHGSRTDESGFVAVQVRDRDGVDIVDIYGTSPGAMGAVVAESVGLVGAGVQPRVAVSGCGDRLPNSPEIMDHYDDFGFLIPRADPREPTVPIVDGCDVMATGTVQVRCPGTDAQRGTLQWVHVSGDGDYLYEPDGTCYAEPMDAGVLIACIDGLIADALARERMT